MRRIGIGYRHPLADWLDGRPPEVQCLEITAEHFFDNGEPHLRRLGRQYPLFVHGLGLSLGTPGPLHEPTLEMFARIVQAADPLWISEHIAFTRTDDVDLGHLNPVAPTRDALAIISDHARELAQRCRKPLILENITSHLRLPGELSETEFLNQLCERADCGLLLDVTNLYINARNHGFDPIGWLHELDAKRIVQLHIVGYSVRDGIYEDHHAEPIQDDLLELARAAIEYAPVQAVILERDAEFQDRPAIVSELLRLETALG